MESLYNSWLQDHLEIHVFVADLLTIDADWVFRNSPLGHWRLYHNDKDGAQLHFRREIFPLQKNRVYILPAGLRFTTSCQGEVEHFFVHFNVAGLPDLALRTLFRHPHALAPSPVLDVLVAELKSELRDDVVLRGKVLYREDGVFGRRSGDVTLQWRLKSAVYEALSLCVRSATPSQTAAGWEFAHEIQPLVAALRFIEENLSLDLNNAFLAEMCGFSRHHFIRVFHASMKKTPAVYIRERRLAEASRLLLFSEQNIETIAKNTGFCDRAHLSRTFKAFYGVSPANYRVSTHGTLIETKT